MPFNRETHESLLSELLNPELDHSRRTDILQELRIGFTEVDSERETLSKTKEKLEKDNSDLIVSNSKLFRQIGVVGTEKEEVIEKKEFSETVTIEQLEN